MAKTNLGKVSITPKGAYNELTAYEKLDVVSYNGSSFLVLKNVQGVVPIDDEENYMLLAKKGENGSGGGGSYSLPIAAPDTLGGVQPVAKTSEMTEAVGVDGTGKLFTKPGASGGSSYNLPVASADTLGGVKVGNNLSITEDGTLNATGGGSDGGERPWEFFKEYTVNESVTQFYIGERGKESDFSKKGYSELVLEMKMQKTATKGNECYVCPNGDASNGAKFQTAFNSDQNYVVTDNFCIKSFATGKGVCFGKTSFGPQQDWGFLSAKTPSEKIQYVYLHNFKLEPGSTIKVWGR